MTEATVAPRKRDSSRRRLSMHVLWSYPAEAGRELYELSNSNSAMGGFVESPTLDTRRWQATRRRLCMELTGPRNCFIEIGNPSVRRSVISRHPVQYFERVDH